MSDYTEEINRLKAEHHRRAAEVREDTDLTEEARGRRIREIDTAHSKAFAEEKRDGSHRSRAALSSGKPGSDTERELLREMRLQREVRELFDEERHDPILAYQEAVRVGDDERMEVIGRVGPRYLKGSPGRRERLRGLAEEQQPASLRRARSRLEEFEQEAADVELGLALQQRTGSLRRTPRGITPSKP